MLSRWLASLLLASAMGAPCHANDEFLDPLEAFRFSAQLKSGGLLEVRYLIAEGYYMYRDRFRFEIEPESVVLGPPSFPAGQWHEDEFFGRSVVFRGSLTIQLPILSGMDNIDAIRLVAVSQGCADAGICYLPTTQTIDFALLSPLGAPADLR